MSDNPARCFIDTNIWLLVRNWHFFTCAFGMCYHEGLTRVYQSSSYTLRLKFVLPTIPPIVPNITPSNTGSSRMSREPVRGGFLPVWR